MSGPYQCILIDPPWPEYGGGGRGAQNHYALVSVPEIAKTILRAPCWDLAESCHLWLWTCRELWKGLQVIDALGFRQVSFLVWGKRGAPGLGQYMRYSSEILLFAVRGPAMVPDGLKPCNYWPTEDGPAWAEGGLIEASRVKADGKVVHSRKPDSIHALVELVSPGPRLEMFARPPHRPGWDVWGNEA